MAIWQCAFLTFTTNTETNQISGTCQTGQIAAGQYKLRFPHDSTGHSFFDEVYEATYSVDAEDRVEGSTLGGQRVGVTGFGFRPGMTIDVYADRKCVLIDDETTEFASAFCITIAKDASRKRRNASGSTPTIITASPNKVSVFPGCLL